MDIKELIDTYVTSPTIENKQQILAKLGKPIHYTNACFKYNRKLYDWITYWITEKTPTSQNSSQKTLLSETEDLCMTLCLTYNYDLIEYFLNTIKVPIDFKKIAYGENKSMACYGIRIWNYFLRFLVVDLRRGTINQIIGLFQLLTKYGLDLSYQVTNNLQYEGININVSLFHYRYRVGNNSTGGQGIYNKDDIVPDNYDNFYIELLFEMVKNNLISISDLCQAIYNFTPCGKMYDLRRKDWCGGHYDERFKIKSDTLTLPLNHKSEVRSVRQWQYYQDCCVKFYGIVLEKYYALFDDIDDKNTTIKKLENDLLQKDKQIIDLERRLRENFEFYSRNLDQNKNKEIKK